MLTTSRIALAALALCPAALASPLDLTNGQVPDFRGAESTYFAGWSTWTGVNGGVALPDDQATTATEARVTTSEGIGFGAIAGGEVCVSGPAAMYLTHGRPGEPISEVVIQLAASTSLQNVQVSLAYFAPMSPDPDYAAPVEVIDLAPGERLYRFRTSTRGLTFGTIAPITGFGLAIQGPDAMCVEELQMDVRHVLETEVAVACGPELNSLLLGAGIDAYGSSVAADNDLTLTATGVPAGAFGMFIVGSAPGFTSCPGGCAMNKGNLCLSGTIARVLPVRQASAGLSFASTLDLTALPFTPTVAVAVGETWYFQAWYRDVDPAPTSNMTSAIGIQFR